MDPSMNQTWSQSEPMDMSQGPSDIDMSNFLDLDGGINLDDMPDLDLGSFGDLQQVGVGSQNTQFSDTMSGSLPASGTLAQDFGGQDQFSMGQNGGQSFIPHGRYSAPNTNPYALQGSHQSIMQQYPQQPLQQHQPHFGYNHGSHVPPTPNSFEMHGEVGRFTNKQQFDTSQGGMFDQRYQVGPDDAFPWTPLASPAGTPHFNIQPDFTTPASFSPLNSPMLHGQHYTQQQQLWTAYHTNPSTAPSSVAPSPANGDVDMLGDVEALPEAAKGPAKRTRRKTGTAKSSGTSTRAKPSPIQKPKKRKSVSLATLGPAAETSVSRSSAQSEKDIPISTSLKPTSASGLSNSEQPSISPEPPSGTVMGPPPKPGSNLQSPAIAAQRQNSSQAPRDSTAAATPKSILSNRSQQPIDACDSTRSVAEAFNDASLEDLALPEAAKTSRRPSLGRIVTAIPSKDSGDQTPRTSARKTPKIGPTNTPSATRLSSAKTSPVFSPLTASTPSVLLKDKKDGKGGRSTSKKRGSESAAGSNTASPAIHPKISPSIKPLLPEGTTLNSPTHALLLASKSNYQNLLEGNHLPGVSYPDHLSSGLTSKRTSHKVAEQGRRNRINDALKEMQELLPKAHKLGANKDSPETPDAAGGAESKEQTKEQKELADVKSSNSKAATVESANEYIRKLQAENAALEGLRKENEEMRRRLEGRGEGPEGAVGSGSGSGSESGGRDSSAEASA
ncbi:hypothetical protein MBLNU230_g2611t1 [Neophaeotheca triangularis]